MWLSGDKRGDCDGRAVAESRRGVLRKDASARTRDKEGIVFVRTGREAGVLIIAELFSEVVTVSGFAPIFPDICYHLTHYKPAAADIPV
ncbi:hypothetical protein MOO35_24270, partial [Escherichia coli]